MVVVCGVPFFCCVCILLMTSHFETKCFHKVCLKLKPSYFPTPLLCTPHLSNKYPGGGNISLSRESNQTKFHLCPVSGVTHAIYRGLGLAAPVYPSLKVPTPTTPSQPSNPLMPSWIPSPRNQNPPGGAAAPFSVLAACKCLLPRDVELWDRDSSGS